MIETMHRVRIPAGAVWSLYINLNLGTLEGLIIFWVHLIHSGNPRKLVSCSWRASFAAVDGMAALRFHPDGSQTDLSPSSGTAICIRPKPAHDCHVSDGSGTDGDHQRGMELS